MKNLIRTYKNEIEKYMQDMRSDFYQIGTNIYLDISTSKFETMKPFLKIMFYYDNEAKGQADTWEEKTYYSWKEVDEDFDCIDEEILNNFLEKTLFNCIIEKQLDKAFENYILWGFDDMYDIESWQSAVYEKLLKQNKILPPVLGGWED